MVELQGPRSNNSPEIMNSYDSGENQNIKNFGRKEKSDKYHIPFQNALEYAEKADVYKTEKDRQSEEYLYNHHNYSYERKEEFIHMPHERSPRDMDKPMGADTSSIRLSKETFVRGDGQMYPQTYTGRQFRSNSISGFSLSSLGREMGRDKHPSQRLFTENTSSPRIELPPPSENHAPTTPAPVPHRILRKEEIEESADSDEISSFRANRGRKKIKMEFIKDKSRRGVTFSKRKKGIMKKAYELNVLTKCEILLVVASETGHVYTFATPKLQPIIKQHENLIQHYLNTLPGVVDVNKMYETSERYATDESEHYKTTDTYGYDGILRGHGYPSGYYNSGYDTDNSPGNSGPRL
ncbi:hypothetical protein NECID01_0810 [Nematocida sp. AWRm77]|nr:hypothetical protein NECID01_0810 [Nematocida sp. AWRm77]